MPRSLTSSPPGSAADYAKIAIFVLAIIIATIALIKYIYLMSTSSLWQDELYTVRYFSSQGAYTSWTDYHLPNNHILFNVINSIWPISLAYEPAFARLLSFVVVSGGFALLMWHAIKERSWAGGAIALLLLAYSDEIDPWNFSNLHLILQARAYGITFAAGVLLALAAREYLLSGSRVWLALIGVATFLGGAALPTFVFLAAPFIAGVLLLRRRLDVLVMAVATGVVGILFYIPTASQILGFASEYGDRFGTSYAHPVAVAQTLMYFFGTEPFAFAYVALFLAVVGFAVIYGDRKRTEFIALGLVSVFVFFVICLVMGTPKVRTTQFACSVVAVVLIVAGSERAAVGWRFWPGVTLVLSLSALPLFVLLIKQIDSKDFLPPEAWRETAEAVEFLKPDEATIYAPYRTWQFAVHLRDSDWPVEEFDADEFRRGHQIVVNSNKRTKRGFYGTDFSPYAVELRVPQSRGRDQTIWFVPEGPNGISSVAIDGTETTDYGPMLDKSSDTMWSTDETQATLTAPVDMRFVVDPDIGCDRLFILTEPREWVARFDIAVIGSEGTREIADEFIRVLDSLVVADIPDVSATEVVLTAKPRNRNRPLSIREAWCEGARATHS